MKTQTVTAVTDALGTAPENENRHPAAPIQPTTTQVDQGFDQQIGYRDWVNLAAEITASTATIIKLKRVDLMEMDLRVAGHWVPTLEDGFTAEELVISITTRYKHLIAGHLDKIHSAAAAAYRHELFKEERERSYKKAS